MGAIHRFFSRVAESDEVRMAEELREWAATLPGTVRISEAPIRAQVKVAGVVRRITIRPVEGFEGLEVILTDGTGEVAARWLGRRSIPGLLLGSRLVVEGVLANERGVKRIWNPTFEFA